MRTATWEVFLGLSTRDDRNGSALIVGELSKGYLGPPPLIGWAYFLGRLRAKAENSPKTVLALNCGHDFGFLAFTGMIWLNKFFLIKTT